MRNDFIHWTHKTTIAGAKYTVFAFGTPVIISKELKYEKHELIIVGYSNHYRKYVEQHVNQDCIEKI
jgi:hypothetical protein